MQLLVLLRQLEHGSFQRVRQVPSLSPLQACCHRWGSSHCKQCGVCHTGSSNRAMCSRLGDRNLQTQYPGPQANAGWVRCCGDTFSLWGGMLAHQLHSWHCVCQWETCGVELVSTPEGDASCFLNFFGNTILCNLCVVHPPSCIFTRTTIRDTLWGLVGWYFEGKC